MPRLMLREARRVFGGDIKEQGKRNSHREKCKQKTILVCGAGSYFRLWGNNF